VAPDVAKILARERPKGKRGGDKRSKAKEQTPARGNDGNGMKRSTLSARLAQEHPDHLPLPAPAVWRGFFVAPRFFCLGLRCYRLYRWCYRFYQK
jgi:hypothetical protein